VFKIIDYSEVYELMHQRKSIRKFKDKELSDKQIQKIIDAGVTAPSSLNSQPWSFVVVKDREKKKKLREIYSSARKALNLYEQDTSFIEHATPIVVVCEDNDYGKILSCGMCIQNMFFRSRVRRTRFFALSNNSPRT